MNHLITQLGYLGLEVSDLARWERFAAEVLGLAVLPGPREDTRLLRMDENLYRFILTQGPADDLAFTGWQSPNAATVEAFGKHLDTLGIAWAWGSDEDIALRAVQQMLHFKDPAGNRHEVYCRPPLASTRFVSPAVASGFVTGSEGLGHIVFSSSAYADTVTFAHDVLGLHDSDQIRVPMGPGRTFEVSFMHANTRHHSFAVAPNPPTPGPHKRIHHFMIEVNAVEEVGFARDRCLAMGQGVLMDIGQHPNDKMISFYGQTPSGFFAEFGWGGVKVDPDLWQVVSFDKLSEWGHRVNGEVPVRPQFPITNAKEKVMSASGIWNVVISTPMGEDKVALHLQAEGASLTGSMKDERGSNEIYDGAVEGDALSWRAKVSHPMPMDLAFSATIDGDKISGGAKSPFGTAPFAGARG